MARTKQKTGTVPMPDLWQSDFKAATMRTNFMLTLTQSMIQYLSATADNVMWDRFDFHDLHVPDNWLATEHALTKRGLVRRRSTDELRRNSASLPDYSCCELTPAGAAVVQLLKVTGIFVEADAALRKKARG